VTNCTTFPFIQLPSGYDNVNVKKILTLFLITALVLPGVVARGEGGARQSSIEWIFYRIKLALLGLFSLPKVFYGPQICQNALVAEAPPRTPLGELTTSPYPLVGWGGRHPLLNSHPLSAFGASIFALSFCAPQCQILATPLVLTQDLYR